MERRKFITALGLLPFLGKSRQISCLSYDFIQVAEVRKYWVQIAYKIAFPVLDALSKSELKRRMPVEVCPGNPGDRRNVSHLEAFGRLMSGIAPWLQLSDSEISAEENSMRKSLFTLFSVGISNAVNPSSPDFMNFTHESQPLVDTAFLAHAFIKAPKLFELLDLNTRKNLLSAFISTRHIIPGMSNWLLFSAIRETFLLSVGEEYLSQPIDLALSKHMEWYKGDGVYGDGPSFHWDYYNSFVIHSLMLDILKIYVEKTNNSADLYKNELTRAQRYCEILERLISPEGTFPPLGRSLTYRAGAFQLLAQLSLNKQLPDSLPGNQVRTALTAVLHKTMDAPSTFDRNGWLQIGLCAHQPELAEAYISTGSLYFCSTVFLPLGLASGDEFWTKPAQDWTARQIWSGRSLKPDHAITN